MRKTAVLFSLLLTPLLAAQTTINIDASQDRHRINPNIYGINLATQAQTSDLNAPLNRWGGNHTTRYNWQQNCSNRARDWFFQTIEDGPAVAAEEADSIITATRNAGSEPMMTVPIIGWVSEMGPNRTRTWSYPRQKFPNQQAWDYPWWPDSGNGFYPDGTPIYGADPHDANMPADHNFMRGWIQHNLATFGNAAGNGVRYYVLDNEYSIWHDTHRDVHPEGASYDEVFSKMRNTAAMIKELDPNALTVGPEEWGWSGYFWSGYDIRWAAQNGEWQNTPDRVAHGGLLYMPFILQSFHNHEQQYGQRLLDVFTLHYYPQSGEYSESTDSWTQGMRNVSTRSLWDPNYTDQSWIGDKVNLIARMRSWVDQYYPGTPIGITEYSWGADGYIGGATAQADILGIFGRENLDLATRWITPATDTPTYKAMKMYRNYDGNKSAFGDISVRATAPNPDQVAAFASIRTSDKAMTVMLVNKQTAQAATTVNLVNFTPTGSAQRWQLTSSNAITSEAAVAISSNALSVTLPAQSITLLVIPGNSADVIDPVITLGSESVNASGLWSFSGTASDQSGISKVTYKIAGGATGNATGTTSWSISGLTLNKGWNYITFTAYDNAGNPKSISKRIVYQVMAPPPVPPKKKKRSIG